MFRNPNGKILSNICSHQVFHDLTQVDSKEKGYIFLLMSISGNSGKPEDDYGFNGAMEIKFKNPRRALNELYSRGYLMERLPMELIIEKITIPEIKALLKAHKLPVSGKRDVLVERLLPALTDDEIRQLQEIHHYHYPTTLGFEMIYSLYALWEIRQLILLKAIKSGSISAVKAAYRHMPHDIGYWDDSESSKSPMTPFSHVVGKTDPVTAFYILCGFKPELYFDS